MPAGILVISAAAPRGHSARGAERWFIYPSLVVEAMEAGKSSTGVPEFGNSTLIRWADDVPNLEELIVTTVIRDAMLASFHSAMGASIPSNANQIVINSLPDPTTLLHIPASASGSGTRRFVSGSRSLRAGTGYSRRFLSGSSHFGRSRRCCCDFRQQIPFTCHRRQRHRVLHLLPAREYAGARNGPRASPRAADPARQADSSTRRQPGIWRELERHRG